MGLDQYLYKKTYIGNKYRKPEERVGILYPQTEKEVLFPIGSEIKIERINEIVESVAYWRKANQIHKWFVDNVQEGENDCKEYYVNKTQLQELIDLCQKVINKEISPKEGLPTGEGFFFGSTEYDEYYYSNLKDTIEQLTPLMEETGDFYYTSSW